MFEYQVEAEVKFKFRVSAESLEEATGTAIGSIKANTGLDYQLKNIWVLDLEKAGKE